jgi:tRNA(fMet)-specific endonuclease VapC
MNPAGSVLLDTNIVVAHFRNDAGITAHLQTASVLYLPWVALGELQYGALRSRQREAQLALIREFLQTAVLLLPDHQRAVRPGEGGTCCRRKIDSRE